MLDVIDRTPTKPGRVRIIPEDGAPFFATVERIDEPIEEGTPLNRALFTSIREAAFHMFAEQDKYENCDFEIQTDIFQSTSGSWQKYKFHTPFFKIPSVSAQIISENALDMKVSIQKVTEKGFEYCISLLKDGSFVSYSNPVMICCQAIAGARI